MKQGDYYRETVPVSDKMLQRFWQRVDIRGPDECWEWQAYKQNGYGFFRSPWGVLVHRFVWRLFRGDPGKLVVMHKCDNRACCNPAHLALGTQADNVADMCRKGRNLGGTSIRKAYQAPKSSLQRRAQAIPEAVKTPNAVPGEK